MPSFRLFPLLAAGAACLTLAACGSDDDPPPQANAPAVQSEPAAPTQTAPGETPTTSAAPDAAVPSDDDGAAAGDAAEPAAPSGDGTSSPDQAGGSTPPADPGSGAAASGRDAKSDPKSKPKSKAKSPDSDSAPQPGQQQAQPNPHDNYANGGAPASKDEAADVRATLIGFQEALGRKDPVAICALTVGLPVKGTATSPMSCSSLSEGGSAPPTDENRRLIASAKVIVADDKATAELAAGFKMPLRKVDGRWRLDYDAINNPGGVSR